MSKKRLDVLGKKYGYLTVLNYEYTKNSAFYKCECDCGNVIITRATRLVRGEAVCCGKKGCFARKGNHQKGNLLPVEIFSTNKIYRAYKDGAKKRGLDFEISKDDFAKLITGNCHYCGSEPQNTLSTKYKGELHKGLIRKFSYNGVDRVDNKKGYVIGNVVSCCPICNFSKWKFSSFEFLQQVSKIYLYQQSCLTKRAADERESARKIVTVK